MNSRPKATILAIGTELTTGQIINRNAAWISERLTALGVEVVLHEVVADDRVRIYEALDRCASLGRLVFVTGGLGPTTDDFTREVVAEWLKKPLVYDELSWQRIVRRLESFGIPVAASNKQQCYFPQRSEIIPNLEGTASAFYSAFGTDQHLWVLPGPPTEVHAVWEAGVNSKLRTLFPNLKSDQLYTWQCLGKSEAELGELVEAALQGSGLTTGYRVHRPYVEVKVWVPEDQIERNQSWIKRVEKTIEHWIFKKSEEDLAETLLQKLHRHGYVSVMDRATQGALAGRVGSLLNKKPEFKDLAGRITWVSEFGGLENLEEWITSVLQFADEETVTLALGGISQSGECVIGLKTGNKALHEVIYSPWQIPAEAQSSIHDRVRAYMTEMALKRWSEWLAYHPSDFKHGL